ncbi:MAG TPA: ribokinase [Candidatus Dormibacteraeota bacterium]|nr:ribokinase [Candidatus Dormibacteraeota bacterium]HEX2680241.1 ribokinase [Candidatus Dormibacteraeota bacterium]
MLGSLNMDLVLCVSSLPKPGETVLGKHFEAFPGGKGANQATAAARLGGTVRLFGRVGTDPYGPEVLRALRRNRVNVRGVFRDRNASTGKALIIVRERHGTNLIAVASGANLRVDDAQVDQLSAGLRKGDVVVLQFEIPVEVVARAARRAKQAGAFVILNAAPCKPNDMKEMPKLDLLVVNQVEARQLSGVGGDLRTAARCLGRRFANAVAVTRGKKGTLLWNGRVSRIQAHAVGQVVDDTGAGDAFIGAIAFGVAHGFGLREAVCMGSAAGAMTVTKLGGNSSPTRRELEKFMKISPAGPRNDEALT